MNARLELSVSRYAADWNEAEHPRGQPDNAGQFSTQRDRDSWMNRKHGRDAIFDVGGEHEMRGNVKVTTKSPIPMVAELHPMDADFLSEVDDDDNEKRFLLDIAEATGEKPQEFTFRNIHTEYGEQQDAFGVTGTGHAREAIDKVSGLLLGSMERHGHAVYFMTAAERSRGGLYRMLARKAESRTGGRYVGLQLDLPGYEAAIAIVRRDHLDAVKKSASDSAIAIKGDELSNNSRLESAITTYSKEFEQLHPRDDDGTFVEKLDGSRPRKKSRATSSRISGRCPRMR